MKEKDLLEIALTFKDEITFISQRMSNSKTPLEIVKWLRNFDSEHDCILALELLSKITFFSEEDLYVQCDLMISKLLDLVDRDYHIYFSPISKYGKSATLLSYYLKKSSAFQNLLNSGKASYITSEFEIEQAKFDKNTVVAFFDDFLGTGGSFIKHFDKFRKLAHDSFSTVKDVYIITVCYMEMAERRIKDKFSSFKLIGNIEHKIFNTNAPFFMPDKMLEAVKNLAINYANKKALFVDSFKVNHNLGFENSEALLGFAYCPPNNTLPIIWSSKSKWKPLLPRFEDDIKQRVQEAKKNLAFAAIRINFSLPETFTGFHGETQIRFIVSGVVWMSAKNVALPTIARTLGISQDIFDSYLQLAKDMKLIDTKNRITDYGKEKLLDLHRNVTEWKNRNKKEVKITSLDYIPKAFSE